MLEYLQQNKIDTNNDELILGLKYKSLQKITDPFNPISYFFHHKWAAQADARTNTIEAINYIRNHLMQTLYALFFTTKEIATISNKTVQEIYGKYLWNIYIAGHGSNRSQASIIAGIPETNFTNLLHFFNSRINTNIIFTASCFGTGERLRLFNIPNLKYILAFGSTTKSVTIRNISYQFKLNNQKKLELIYKTDISEFFESLRHYSGEAYFDLFNKFQSFWKLNKKRDKKFYKKNIPQIKLPNTNWFQVIDLQKNELNLNKLLIDLHNYNKKPIIVKNKRLLFLNQQYQYRQHPPLSRVEEFFRTQPGTRIIQKEKKNEINIKFPIIFQGIRAPLVISMEPLDARYNFSSIEAPDFGLCYLALKFMGLSTQMYNRTFNIKSLTIHNPYFPSISYPGSFKDGVLFNIAIPQPINTELSKQNTILLTNITVKVRTTGPKPIFRLKFEYNGKRYVIAKPTYQEIATILKRPKLEDLVSSSKEMLLNVATLHLKPTSKYKSKPKIEPLEKGFEEIERALEKKAKEQLERNIQHKIFTLQVLSQTLGMLSSI